MPSSAASTAMEAVVHYKKKLLRHVSDQESDVLLHCLVKLDRVPMTIDILQETGVGRVVNSLKKGLDPDSEVAQLARNIVVKWKDIVANHQDQEQKLEDTEDGCDYEGEAGDPEDADRSPPDLKPEAVEEEEEKPKSKSDSKKSSSSSHKHKRHHKDREHESKSHSSSKEKKKEKSKSKERDRERSSSSSKKHKSSSSSSSKSKRAEEDSAFGAALSKPRSSKTSSSENGSGSLVEAFDINPNYKPLHAPPPPPSSQDDSDCFNRFGGFRKSADEELSALMSKKGTKKTMYSGIKRSAFKEVPSLKDICIHVLQENVDNIEQCGGLPYDVLEPVLMRASPQTLMQIEEYNQYLMDETGQLWEKHCKKDFPKCQREEFESYKEMYERCTTERAAKLEVLTAKMGTSYKNAKDNVRRTKLAYVNTAAKPPRSVKRAQERNGTALSQPQQPAKRGRPPLGTGPGSSSAPKKPKIAPMMAKTLKLARGLKGGFRR